MAWTTVLSEPGWLRIAVGVLHMPRTTWANRSAVSWSRMTTEEPGGMLRHSLATAVISPVPILRNAMPCASTPLVFVTLMSRVVSAVGMSIEAAQQEAIVIAVARVRPSWAA